VAESLEKDSADRIIVNKYSAIKAESPNGRFCHSEKYLLLTKQLCHKN
jgi:hypothetical protein